MPRPSTIAWSLCLIALFAFGAMLVTRSNTMTGPPVSEGASAPATSGDIGGPFTLTDQNGKTVTEKSWPGKYLMFYFGFTHCPDVCPLGLSKMAQALNSLPAATAQKIQPIFVTVDPARDKAADLKTYVPLFYPHLIGLTGTDAQIEKMKSLYKVYAAKQGDGPDYMVNHSAFTYLMNPDGSLARIFAHETTSKDMAAQIKSTVK